MLELGEGRTDNSRSNGKKQIPLGMTNNRTGNGNGNSNDNSNDNGNDSLTSGLSAEVY